MSILYVCNNCGSRDIIRDGELRWSEETQDWEISFHWDMESMLFCAECGDCNITKIEHPKGEI